MRLTKTTREILFSRLDDIKSRIESLRNCIDKRQSGERCYLIPSWMIEINLLKREYEIIKQALIDNEYNEI